MPTTLRPFSRHVAPYIALALGLLICSAVEASVPQYPIEDFLTNVNYRGSSFSPDTSKILVASDKSGIFNLYAVPVDGSGHIQLTHSTTDHIQAIGYFPKDERILYTSDRGGDENNHIYVRELDGKVVDLTPGEKVKANMVGWADDDRSFFLQTNERDARFFDTYEIQADGYARTLFHQDDQALQLSDLSPDKRWLAFDKPNTTSDSDVLIFDREKKELKNITEHTGWVLNGAMTFSPDSRYLYYVTDKDAEFSYLKRYELATGKHEEVLRAEWDIGFATFSRNRAYFLVFINRDAANEIRLFKAATMEPVALPSLPGLDVNALQFSRDGKRMAIYASSSRRPGDLFVLEVGGTEPRQLTRSLNPKISADHLVDGEVVRFKSFDGLEIPGILYKPHGASAANKVPALVWVHGGPGGQSRLGYIGMLQYLVNHGYAVYAINNRGSSGYGRTFFKADDRDHGNGDLKDCVESKKMLIATGWVDAQRIGIIGGSYGGYMVLAALAFQPQEFAVGINLYGVSNWLRTLKSIPPYWESFKKALYEEIGDPVTDEARLKAHSPLLHAKNIVKPLFVLQGANDPRVIQPESDEIVAAARSNGTPVEYLLFPDEGHGITKKENQAKAYTQVVAFLDQHLKGAK